VSKLASYCTDFRPKKTHHWQQRTIFVKTNKAKNGQNYGIGPADSFKKVKFAFDCNGLRMKGLIWLNLL